MTFFIHLILMYILIEFWLFLLLCMYIAIIIILPFDQWVVLLYPHIVSYLLEWQTLANVLNIVLSKKVRCSTSNPLVYVISVFFMRRLNAWMRIISLQYGLKVLVKVHLISNKSACMAWFNINIRNYFLLWLFLN